MTAAAAQRLAATIAELRRGIFFMRQQPEPASCLAIGVIHFTPQSYHISLHAAAVCLRFFSAALRNSYDPRRSRGALSLRPGSPTD
jgi:hypothetical protein